MNPDQLLTQATCAVLIDGQIAGTAWLVSRQGHLLTAGHVLGLEQPISHVEVQFVGDVPRRAEKIEWRFDQALALDFAVLKLTVPISRDPLPISLAKNVAGTFRLCGYGTTLKKNAQFSGRGEFSGPMYIGHSVRTHLFALRSLDFGKEGNSGGAIFSEKEQAAVGIMIEAARARSGLQHDVVLAMPLYRVAQLWKPLEQLAKSRGKGRTLPLSGQVWGRFRQVISKFQAIRQVIPRAASRLTGKKEHLGMPALLQDFTSQPAHLFICYKRDAADDEQLAHYLHNFLRAQGHDVFIDKSMPAGTSWIEEIDRQLQTSDFLVVLLSPESVESEMVQAEVRRAYDYRKLHERPRTLPIRLAYEGLLPYAIDLFLDPLQYVAWQSRADNERVAEEILAAIQGRLSPQRPIGSGREGERAYPQSMMSGRETPSQKPPTPSGSQDLELPAPSGIAHGIFYMERDVDTDLKRQVAKKGGTLTTIRAPRQTGKTSLLAQGVVQAREHGIQVVNLDLQRVERAYLQTYDGFLRYLAEYIVWELALDIAQVEQSWRGPLGSQDKLSKVLAYVLAESDKPIMLAMDEVDRLLETPFHSDFFALVRAWHNNHAYYEAWKKLNIVMVISTEPHLLIADVNRSPFNVGLKLDLEDFSETQVRHLNQRHGSPVKEEEIPQMMRLLNGHPYLTRQALYTLVTENLTWDNLTPIATSQQGPFGEHLRRYHWLLRNQNKLKAGLKQVIQQGRCPDDNDMTFYRLLRAGLIKGDSSKSCSCRCDLYRIYFEDNL